MGLIPQGQLNSCGVHPHKPHRRKDAACHAILGAVETLPKLLFATFALVRITMLEERASDRVAESGLSLFFFRVRFHWQRSQVLQGFQISMWDVVGLRFLSLLHTGSRIT